MGQRCRRGKSSRGYLGWLIVIVGGVAPAVARAALDVAPIMDQSLGVCLHAGPSPEELQLLQRAGLRTVRMDFKWELTEKKVGRYDFSVQDQLVAALTAARLNAIFILDYANPIYGSDGKPPFTQRGREALSAEGHCPCC